MNLVTTAWILAATGYGLVAYAFMYMMVYSTVVASLGPTPSFFDIKTIFLECLGIVLRKARKYVTFKPSTPWYQVFKLNPHTADYPDIERVSMQMLLKMHKLRWYYPNSQRQVILQLSANGFKHVQHRKMLEAVAREAYERTRRADGGARHRENPGMSSSPVAYGWRAVLGLDAGECDVTVIKKAYRTRALKAHPDRGGSDAAMARLNEAIAQAREELSFV